MNSHITKYAWFCMVLAFTGCASIKFYEEKGDKEQEDVGFLYYPPKPYLLIETKDNNLVASIISLPDLSRPHRVKQDNGWGSAELGFEIENGMIKSFNSKTDSKGPETLTSIAGLGTAHAALVTAKNAKPAAELSAGDTVSASNFEGFPTKILPINYKVKAFMDGSTALKTKVLPLLQNNKSELSNEIETTKGVIAILEGNQTIDFDPFNPDALLAAVEKKRKIAKNQVDILNNISSTLGVYADNKAEKPELILLAKNANDKLKPIIKSLLGFSLRSSSINGLYEINYIKGRLNLRKVIFE